MKNIYRIFICVAMLALSGIGNVSVAGWYDYVYSNAYDGYTNIRQRPTTKSAILGTLPNGNNAAEFYGESYENANWYHIYYNGIEGYVAKSQVGRSPSPAVNLNITTNWIYGVWVNGEGNTLTCDKKGNFTLSGNINVAGKWRLTGGNDITLKATYSGWKQTYYIDLYNNMIGDYYRQGSAQDLEAQLATRINNAAVDTSNISESDLNNEIHNSRNGNIPSEYQWILGEWHSESTDRNDLIIIGNNKAFAYMSESEAIMRDDIDMEKYCLRYKFNIALNKWYVVLVTEEDMPIVYIDNSTKQLFFESNGEGYYLTHIQGSENHVDEGGLSLTMWIIIAACSCVLSVLIGVIIFLATKVKSNK
jgi:hypothetical protein